MSELPGMWEAADLSGGWADTEDARNADPVRGRWRVQGFIRWVWAHGQDGVGYTTEEWERRGPAYVPTYHRTKWGALRQARRLEESHVPGMVIVDIRRTHIDGDGCAT